MNEEDKIRMRIIELRTALRNSDYKAIKFAEGEIPMNEYAPVKEQRKAFRAEINALETRLKLLRG